jgi:hypothetical protein
MPEDPDDPRDQPFPINSVVEGSIELIETEGKKKDTYKVRIVTNELEKRKMFFECDINDYARKVLEYEAKHQTEDQPECKVRHYGLIIVRPGPELKEYTMVTDFISYHRHPTAFITRPTASRYGISDYTEAFEKRTLDEGVLKNLRESYDPKPVDRNKMEKVLKVITLKERVLNHLGELGESYSKDPKPVDLNKIEKVLKDIINQLEDTKAHK